MKVTVTHDDHKDAFTMMISSSWWQSEALKGHWIRMSASFIDICEILMKLSSLIGWCLTSKHTSLTTTFSECPVLLLRSNFSRRLTFFSRRDEHRGLLITGPKLWLSMSAIRVEDVGTVWADAGRGVGFIGACCCVPFELMASKLSWSELSYTRLYTPLHTQTMTYNITSKTKWPIKLSHTCVLMDQRFCFLDF